MSSLFDAGAVLHGSWELEKSGGLDTKGQVASCRYCGQAIMLLTSPKLSKPPPERYIILHTYPGIRNNCARSFVNSFLRNGKSLTNIKLTANEFFPILAVFMHTL